MKSSLAGPNLGISLAQNSSRRTKGSDVVLDPGDLMTIDRTGDPLHQAFSCHAPGYHGPTGNAR